MVWTERGRRHTIREPTQIDTGMLGLFFLLISTRPQTVDENYPNLPDCHYIDGNLMKKVK